MYFCVKGQMQFLIMQKSSIFYSFLKFEVSGGSRISPRWGTSPPGWEGVPTYDFVKFPQNCMELKEFGIRVGMGEGGLGARDAPPLDPPLEVAH